MLVTVVVAIEYIVISAFDMISQTDEVKSQANKPRRFLLLTLYGYLQEFLLSALQPVESDFELE